MSQFQTIREIPGTPENKTKYNQKVAELIKSGISKEAAHRKALVEVGLVMGDNQEIGTKQSLSTTYRPLPGAESSPQSMFAIQPDADPQPIVQEPNLGVLPATAKQNPNEMRVSDIEDKSFPVGISSIVQPANEIPAPGVMVLPADPSIGQGQQTSRRLLSVRDDRIRNEMDLTQEELQSLRTGIRERSQDDRVRHAQDLRKRQNLAKQEREARQAGDNARADQIREQIANMADADRTASRELAKQRLALRGSISDLPAEEQITRREKSREALNAQLPDIAQHARKKELQAASYFQSQLADIGRKAYELQNGGDASFLTDELAAQFAQTNASPEAIMRVTRGVGLPTNPAPGASDFAERVEGLAQSGGIDFPEFQPSNRKQLDFQSLNNALSIMKSEADDASALRHIARNQREQAVLQSEQETSLAQIEAGQARKAATPFRSPSSADSGQGISTINPSMGLRESMLELRKTSPESMGNMPILLSDISNNVILDQIANAVKNDDAASINATTASIDALIADPNVPDDILKAAAGTLLKQIERNKKDLRPVRTGLDIGLGTARLSDITNRMAQNIEDNPTDKAVNNLIALLNQLDPETASALGEASHQATIQKFEADGKRNR